MGRWTPKYYDQVLVTKVENLVNGAIRRCKLEEDDTKLMATMTYERFVEGLEEGDSFTTTLVEILVKELADRQTRKDSADKRLIGARTAESLQSLAVSATYRRPYSRQRNRSNMTIDAAAHTTYDPSDSPDDDDFDDASMVDSFGGMEGARIDSALYDMYSSRAPPLPSSIRPLPYMSAHTHLPRPSDLSTFRLHDVNQSRTQLPQIHPPLPRLTSNRAAPSSSRHNVALHRQLSIRRAARNRMADFHDFASRRRNSQRTIPPEGEHTSTAGGVLHPPRSPVDNTTPVIPAPPPGYPTSPLPRASLFEPPSPRPREQPLPSPSPPPEIEDTGVPFRSASWDQSAYGLSLAASLGLPPQSESSSGSTSRNNTLPRLRRGGLRPPESLLNGPEPGPDTPHASEAISLLRPERSFASEWDRGSFSGEFDRVLRDWSNGRDGFDILRDEPPPSMPTPRSISPPENTTAAGEEESIRNAEANSQS